MALAHVPEQIAPDRHVLAAMGWYIDVPTNRACHVRCGKLPALFLAQDGQISRRCLQRFRRRSAALAISAMAYGTVVVVHLFSGGRRGWLHGNMFYFLLLRERDHAQQ